MANVPQDMQTDQTMCHLMGDFARGVARDLGQYRDQAGGDPSEYYESAETGQALEEYRERRRRPGLAPRRSGADHRFRRARPRVSETQHDQTYAFRPAESYAALGGICSAPLMSSHQGQLLGAVLTRPVIWSSPSTRVGGPSQVEASRPHHALPP